MSSLILGTAGHIDHGKTALIKALTGVDTDRLKAEKERGISIELGFARLDLPRGGSLGIVDVPGHEKLVRTMVSGATGMDLVLLVVAADDGVMPQTVEHLAIIDLLGIEKGIVAITKTDLADHDWVDLVKEDIKELLKGTSIEGSPIISVSVRDGSGIDELVTKMDAISRGIERKMRDLPFRLPVDRVFTISGSGTVVTGTSWSGIVRVADKVEVQPRDLTCRVRSLQVHGNKVQEAGPGVRVAINLAGVSLGDVLRGDYIVSQEFRMKKSPKLMLELKLLKGTAPLKNRSVVRLHHGTREVIGRVIIPSGDELKPGESGLVSLRLSSPLVAAYGDRYIMRSYSPVGTIGGGKVLIPNLISTRRKDNETLLMIADRLRDEDREGAVRVAIERIHHALSEKDLTAITGLWGQDLNEALMNAGSWFKRIVSAGESFYCPKEWPQKMLKEIAEALAKHHQSDPSAIGIEKESFRVSNFSKIDEGVFSILLNKAVESRIIKRENGLYSHPDAGRSAMDSETKLREKIYERLAVAPYITPTEDELAKEFKQPVNLIKRALSNLISSKRVVRIKPDLIFTSEAVEDAKRSVKDKIISSGGITPSDFKELLATSRKYAVPLLEHFDSIRFTRREGDKRVMVQ